jgi:hypothetical protein
MPKDGYATDIGVRRNQDRYRIARPVEVRDRAERGAVRAGDRQ